MVEAPNPVRRSYPSKNNNKGHGVSAGLTDAKALVCHLGIHDGHASKSYWDPLTQSRRPYCSAYIPLWKTASAPPLFSPAFAAVCYSFAGCEPSAACRVRIIIWRRRGPLPKAEACGAIAQSYWTSRLRSTTPTGAGQARVPAVTVVLAAAREATRGEIDTCCNRLAPRIASDCTRLLRTLLNTYFSKSYYFVILPRLFAKPDCRSHGDWTYSSV